MSSTIMYAYEYYNYKYNNNKPSWTFSNVREKQQQRANHLQGNYSTIMYADEYYNYKCNNNKPSWTFSNVDEEQQQNLEETQLANHLLDNDSIVKFGIPFVADDYNVYIVHNEYPQNTKVKTLKEQQICEKALQWEIIERHENNEVKNRQCSRCFLPYLVNGSNDYWCNEICSYHPGKLQDCYTSRGHSSMWSCCNRFGEEEGCTSADGHIWTGLLPGWNGPLEGYVETQPSPSSTGPYGVYGLDCEMVTTEAGMELARVTIISHDSSVLYDRLVKPQGKILDYHTQFSGLRKEDLEDVKTTLKNVQAEILSFVSAQTILVGHSIGSDLRALKIIHTNIIDTCELFPHSMGLPLKNSLKYLSKVHLKKTIQSGEHDSFEDAITALQLARKKILGV